MQVSRKLSIVLNFVINELLPPALRDSRWVMGVLFKLAFGERADIFLNFRERAPFMSELEYERCYRETAACNLIKGSDLNAACLERIPREVVGSRVVEVGCGRGLLAGRLAARRLEVTACDIITPEADARPPGVRFVTAPAERLPFADGSFDTAVCTHVLEHVRDLDGALVELRRVATRRLIIVVPRERPYRFGFNLHLSFFPYRYSVINAIGKRGSGRFDLRLEGGDWFYVEELV